MSPNYCKIMAKPPHFSTCKASEFSNSESSHSGSILMSILCAFNKSRCTALSTPIDVKSSLRLMPATPSTAIYTHLVLDPKLLLQPSGSGVAPNWDASCTLHNRLVLKSNTQSSLTLECYSDTDWAGRHL